MNNRKIGVMTGLVLAMIHNGREAGRDDAPARVIEQHNAAHRVLDATIWERSDGRDDWRRKLSPPGDNSTLVLRLGAGDDCRALRVLAHHAKEHAGHVRTSVR